MSQARTTLLQILDTSVEMEADIAPEKKGDMVMNSSFSVPHNFLAAIGDDAKSLCCVFRVGLILRAIDAMVSFIRGSQED
jgi:hypothetical protein